MIQMKSLQFYTGLFFILLLASCQSGCGKSGVGDAGPPENPPPDGSEVGYWLTRPDKSALLQQQSLVLNFSDASNGNPTITVDKTKEFQGIDGFGYTLTGGSAMLINKMNPPARQALLQELFGRGEGAIGVSYLRISIGASDLSEEVFTYNDLEPGETDLPLEKFSLAPEQKDLIPVLKMILAIQPEIRIMGSPWTAPAWMKTNGSFIGGSLKPEYYDVYARYFVKYIKGMEAEGVILHAITIQNEPLHPGNNPSMYMEAEDQADFIKNHLGPAFRDAGITTRIVIYDHNADRPDYPITILDDPEARQYVDGSAFHLYAGNINALSQVHNAYPDKHLYFTEQWIGGPGDFAEELKWHVENLIVGATRNWCRTVLEWNLASDPNYGPHTDNGGCTSCLGAVTISGSNITRNPAYYIIGHPSKFVPAGSVRIGSSLVTGLPNVAFQTPENKIVVIVLNSGSEPRSFNIGYDGEIISVSMPAGAVGTFVW